MPEEKILIQLSALQRHVIETTASIRLLLESDKPPPPPTDDRSHCQGCSLYDLCQPELIAADSQLKSLRKSLFIAVLLNDCRSARETVGLDPQLGFLHAVRPGRPALALDLMEEFRSVIADRLAVTLINRRQIREANFDRFGGGAVLLNDQGRKTVITAYQERKQESLQHPLLEESIPIGLLPHTQARLLARVLRGDLEGYLPYLHR